MRRQWLYMEDSNGDDYVINLGAVVIVNWAGTGVTFTFYDGSTLTTNWTNATDAESVYDQVVTRLDAIQQLETV